MASSREIPWSKVLASIIRFQVGGWLFAVCSLEYLSKNENSEGTDFCTYVYIQEEKIQALDNI